MIPSNPVPIRIVLGASYLYCSIVYLAAVGTGRADPPFPPPECPPAISVVAGDWQFAPAGTNLDEPLTVQVACADGSGPVNDVEVIFSTEQGTLSRTNNGGGESRISVFTNSFGRASAFFQMPSNDSSRPVITAMVFHSKAAAVTHFTEFSGYQPIPTLSLAALYVSQGTTSEDIRALSIDDHNHVVFAYRDGDAFVVKNWDNNMVTDNQVLFPTSSTSDYTTTDTNGDSIRVHRTAEYDYDYDDDVTKSGRLFGPIRITYSYPDGEYEPEIVTLAFTSTDSTTSIFPTGEIPLLPAFHGYNGISFTFNCLVDRGYEALSFSFTELADLFWTVSFDGVEHTFPENASDALFQGFFMSDTGWVVGEKGLNSEFFPVVWDGSSLTMIGSGKDPWGINNEGVVVGVEGSDGFLWRSGTTNTFHNVLGQPGFVQWSSEIGTVYDFMCISNANSDGTVTILFNALYEEDSSGNNWDPRWFLLKLDAQMHPIALHVLNLPGNIYLPQYLTAQGTMVTWSDDFPEHAVLLLPVELSKVTFLGGHYHSVLEDGSAKHFSQVHADNQWEGPNLESGRLSSWQDPICYSAGSSAEATVVLKTTGDWPAALNIKIKGVGQAGLSAGYDFPETQGIYDAANHTITAAAMVCDQEFPANTVGYLNPLEIEWQISIDGGTSWQPAGNSRNECFVTRVDPPLDPAGDGDTSSTKRCYITRVHTPALQMIIQPWQIPGP